MLLERPSPRTTAASPRSCPCASPARWPASRASWSRSTATPAPGGRRPTPSSPIALRAGLTLAARAAPRSELAGADLVIAPAMGESGWMRPAQIPSFSAAGEEALVAGAARAAAAARGLSGGRRCAGPLAAGRRAAGLVGRSRRPRPSTTGRPRPPGAWLAAAGLEARYETVDGLRVRYVRAGRGPAVVLVHGFASSIYTWKDVIPALAAGPRRRRPRPAGLRRVRPARRPLVRGPPARRPRAHGPPRDRQARPRRQQHGRGDRRGRGRGAPGARGPPRAHRRRGLQPARRRPARAWLRLAMSRAGVAPAAPARQAPRGGGLAPAGLPRRRTSHAGARSTEYLAAACAPGHASPPSARSAPRSGTAPAVVAESLPRVRRARRSCSGATTTAGSRSPTPTGSWPPSPARARSSSRPCGHMPQEEKPEEVARAAARVPGGGGVSLTAADRALSPLAARLPLRVDARWARLTSVSRAFCAIGLCGYWRTICSTVAAPSAGRPDVHVGRARGRRAAWARPRRRAEGERLLQQLLGLGVLPVVTCSMMARSMRVCRRVLGLPPRVPGHRRRSSSRASSK